MKFSKTKKYLLLAATLWPLLYPFVFLGFMFATFIPAMESSHASSFPPFFFVFFLIHFITIIGSLALMVYYVYLIMKSKLVKKDDQVLWVVLVLVGSTIGMAAFWYRYIFKEPKRKK